ncbi:MAG: NTP transferase domain-containing protein, partial [bacterium]
MSDPKTVAIIQARMGSSRLPGKVLMDIAGKPMLEWVVSRVRQARRVHEVLVATTSDTSDDPVAEFCQDKGIQVYRGSTFDVLDRYYQAARQSKADAVVRVT